MNKLKDKIELLKKEIHNIMKENKQMSYYWHDVEHKIDEVLNN